MTTGSAVGVALSCDIAELRTLFLFEKLSEDQLDWLCRNGHVEIVEPGYLCREGDPAAFFYVLLDGEVATSRQVGVDDVEVTRTSQRGVYGGAWTAYLGDRIAQTYKNSFRVTRRARFYVLEAALFAQLMHEWFPMAVHLLEGLFFGVQDAQQAIGARERLLALGSLTAGLTHELNNPAAAAVRATSSLRGRLAAAREGLASLAVGAAAQATLETLARLQQDAVGRLSDPPVLTPIETADREDRIGDWCESHDIGGGWDLAATFVSAGIDAAWLERIAEAVPDNLEEAVRWLSTALEIELLLTDIEDATTRISALVAASRQYSQLDRSPSQSVDVHDLLDATLVMLSGKLGPKIAVVREYDRSLPTVTVHAAELNQVWTNLVDNALQAMAGAGTLTIRTSRVVDEFQVEIVDTGPGIPAGVTERIFEPFFTTKPVGQGTGLGLDISWRIVNRHHGELSVQSEPGDTRFRVRLPLTQRSPRTPEEATP